MPTDIKDIYWIAGLLEGEGCFFLGKNGCVSIRLTMTDKDVVEKVCRIFKADCVVYERKPKSYNWNHKISYTVNIYSDKSIEWMMTIYSLMSIRRKEEIRRTIYHWSMCRFKRHVIKEVGLYFGSCKACYYERQARLKNAI